MGNKLMKELSEQRSRACTSVWISLLENPHQALLEFPNDICENDLQLLRKTIEVHLDAIENNLLNK